MPLIAQGLACAVAKQTPLKLDQPTVSDLSAFALCSLRQTRERSSIAKRACSIWLFKKARRWLAAGMAVAIRPKSPLGSASSRVGFT
jgi:hypothetical protein